MGRRFVASEVWCERVVTAMLLSAVVMLSCAAAAVASTRPPVKIAEGVHDQPSLAVTESGTAVIAWNSFDPPAQDAVHYCVLALKASSCQSAGTLTIPDSTAHIDGVQVLANGSQAEALDPTITILASAYGLLSDAITEWQSTDGGATWQVFDNGLPVANSGPGDTFMVGGVVLPGGSQLGYGWTTVGGSPTFDAFSSTAPPVCSPDSLCPFATLQPSSERDQVSNNPGSIASATNANPGVLGVYYTQETTGSLGCRTGDGEGLGFVYGSGIPSATNSYSVSPGQPGSAWQAPVALDECGLAAPASLTVGGGQLGLGIIGSDDAGAETFYQHFDPTTRTFGKKVDIINDFGSYPSLTEQPRSNLTFATFEDASTDAIELAGSYDGGQTWTIPVALKGTAGSASVSSVSDSDGWVAWLRDNALYATSFDDENLNETDLIPQLSGGASATSTSSTMTVTVRCSAPCTVTITVSRSGAGAGRDAYATAHPQGVLLATGRTRLRHAGAHRVTLRLTRSGRRLLRRHHHLIARLTLSERAFKRTFIHTSAIRITPQR